MQYKKEVFRMAKAVKKVVKKAKAKRGRPAKAKAVKK